MLPGFSGSLVSEYFAEEFLEELFGTEMDAAGAAVARACLLRQRCAVSGRLGPVCGPRQVYDLVTSPMAAALGLRPAGLRFGAQGRLLIAAATGSPPTGVLMVTTGWGENLDSIVREGLRDSVAAGAAWCLCVNGQQVRLLDVRHSAARRFAQFDIESALDHEETFAVFWTLARCDSLVRPTQPAGTGDGDGLSLVERVIAASDRNTVGVCRLLRDGVLQALAELLSGFVRCAPRQRVPSGQQLASAHRQSLTVIYRVLFLLFAESRRLVPTWHPVYRAGYSLDAARVLAERRGPAIGLWETLQAISRLSHAGCRAGDLRVTPFNGRLFSPTETPLAEGARLDDETARRMILALSTTPRRGGRARIVYRDLDVEQLGAVYESLLDYTPRLATGRIVRLEPGSGLRKATATFYTPRALTTYLVRRTLSPLVAEATPEQILSLRVLDPAMGSGAFLVAACRFLAAAYENALVSCGRCLPGEVDEADRRAFRRSVAQRCLYGVDLNPMAVQLARLSLWLATLAPDRPLTFLDHRLLVGDSLVGASVDDVLRRRAPGRSRPKRSPRDHPELPLFGADAIGPALRSVLPGRIEMAEQADDTIDAVRRKERLLDALGGSRSPLARWKAVLDLWCAQPFLPAGTAAGPGILGALADHLLSGRSALAAGVADGCIAQAEPVIAALHPFHWTLEYPEVFSAPDGAPLPSPGFDAVVGNPPWDMVRADNDGPAGPLATRAHAVGLLRFARDSGIYRAQGDGHANRFQLFLERAFHLARRGGRVGLLLPWGLAADHGCAPLRRLLFDHAAIDSLIGFDNADRIFPIHRSVRFLALTATTSGCTPFLPARLGERDPASLDRIPSDGVDPAHFPTTLSRALLERLGGDGLAVPDVRSREDVALLEKLFRFAPALCAEPGWRVEFGRELNATDDRRHFVRGEVGLPVLEGKHIDAFRVSPSRAARRIPLAAARALLDPARTFQRSRLAYRDVSSATNRLTLIGALIPAGCVTVHTLFCLRTLLPRRDQFFLCGILNSLVANFIVRFWVSSHVTTAIVGRLPVPRPSPDSPALRSIAALASILSRAPVPLAHPAYPRLQAEVARLYGLTETELQHVLGRFGLIERNVKERIHDAFSAQRT